jgi:hypothetical protein
MGADMRWVRAGLAFMAALVVGAALGTAGATQFVLDGLMAIGVDIPLGVRLATTGRDLVGMGPTFALVLIPGFLIGFAVAGLVSRLLPGLRLAIYVGAGAVAMVTTLLAMTTMLGLPPIAGARTDAGLAVQALAGAVAGLVFARAVVRPA